MSLRNSSRALAGCATRRRESECRGWGLVRSDVEVRLRGGLTDDDRCTGGYFSNLFIFLHDLLYPGCRELSRATGKKG